MSTKPQPKTPPQPPAHYDVVVRNIGVSQAVSIRSRRGRISVQGVEKVVPPTLVYGEGGEYNLVTLQEVIKEWKPARYKSRSKDFNPERVASAEVSQLMKLLENYPTMEQEQAADSSRPHPLAEILYSTMVYQMPTPELQDKLSKMDVITAGIYQSECIELASKRLGEEQGIFLDQHAVVKKDVGQQVYIAGGDGVGISPKFFSLGFSNAMPLDRIARELGQLKAAEKFISPHPVPFEINPLLKPYITGLNVAIIWTESSMLDSGDLYPSSIPKLAAHIVKKTEVRDLDQVPYERQKLKPKIFHAGIELVHEETEVIDELAQGFPCLKLLMPGGVKFAAQLQVDTQAKCGDQDVDLVIDVRTLASKGAVALMSMLSPEAWALPNPTLAQCWEIVRNLPQQTITIGDQQYTGYVGVLPVFRTHQRYSELSKGSNRIGCDIISHATLGIPLKVRPELDADYQELKDFRKALAQTSSGGPVNDYIFMGKAGQK